MTDAPLVRVVQAISELTRNGHLPEPGTVILSKSLCTIMPEYMFAPIRGLLAWSEHLDGQARYDASLLWQERGGDVPTVIRAHGTLEGFPVVIVASTTRPFMPLMDAPDPYNEPLPVTWVQVLEMSLNEKDI